MNTKISETEAKLIQGCLEGDRKQQKALYTLYSPKLFAICLKYTKNKMDAEDVLQDGFVKLFKNLEQYKGDGSFDGWVRRIFINTAIEHLRRNQVAAADCGSIENTVPDKQPGPLDNLYQKDLMNMVKDLSRGYKTVFNLYEIEGFSHQEIARKLGITESTSKSQFARAKISLRSIFSGSHAAKHR